MFHVKQFPLYFVKDVVKHTTGRKMFHVKQKNFMMLGQKCHAMKSHVHFAQGIVLPSSLGETILRAKVTMPQAACEF